MASLPGRPVSHWLEETVPARPPLRESTEVDAVVVGGGIAGVCGSAPATAHASTPAEASSRAPRCAR
ncbi:hypothetical protein [Streptomyces sp. NPDC050560]|uniref:hypothetical protein n=1 Tax=Streptomyces sp. NPDC050560 TaxID=3365630 RepID=UPI00379D0F8F